MKRSKTEWYRIKSTGKMIRCEKIGYGTYRDVHTNNVWFDDELEYVGRRNVRRITPHFGKLGLNLFARSFFNNGSWFLTPAFIAKSDNGNDMYFQIEMKFLCFGIGFRIIWLKRRKSE